MKALDANGIGRDELMRVLAPRGTLCILENGRWTKTVQPRPEEMDDWTHPHHGPDGNMVSTDRLVRFLIGLRWIGGTPRSINKWAGVRGWVLANGRCYIVSSSEIDNLGLEEKTHYLVCSDAFNGLPLWKIPLAIVESGGALHWRNTCALYANWQFNQPKAVLLEDSYVNNNGILYGKPRFEDDGEHPCVVFNGNGQYAEAPPSAADVGELTIDMMVNRSGGKDGRLFDFGTAADECFYLSIAGQSGKPTLTARHNGKTYTVAASGGIPANKWVRVRVEMNGSTASIYVDGKQVARKAFAPSPRMVFIGDRPEGNFIACGRNKDQFSQGRMDHFRIYRKVHDDFNALGPPPFALTQTPESADGLQQSLKYNTTVDWDDRIVDDGGRPESDIPPKMKKWLLHVRGY